MTTGAEPRDPWFEASFSRSLLPQTHLAATGCFLQVNDAFCRLVGRDREDLVGLRPEEITHRSDSGDADAALCRLLRGDVSTTQIERLLAHVSGAPVPALVTATAVKDNSGSVVGVAASIQDRSVLRDAESQLRDQERLFLALGERARDAAIVTDGEGRMLFLSPGVKTLFGYEPDEILSAEGWDFIHPDDLSMAREVFDRVVAQGGTETLSLRVRAVDGSWRWVDESLTNLLASPVGGVVCNLVDVTPQREAERALRRVEERNRAIVETAAEGIWVASLEGTTSYVNATLAQMLGLSLEQLYEARPEELFAREQRETIATRLRERATRGAETYDVVYDHPDGGLRYLRVSATPIGFADGDFQGSLAMVTDATEARRVEEELRHAALHDTLTDLPNRALLLDRLEQAACTRQRHADRQLGVLFVDLDDFKLINDSRGHDTGDEVLVQVARRLTSAVRSEDTVARLGGDEFVVLTISDEPDVADRAAQRVLTALDEPVPLPDGGVVHVSASIGIATTPAADPADLLRFADTAMFSAKTAGRGLIRHYDRRLSEEAERLHAMTTDLRLALHADSLDMHYQPVVELSTGAVIAYEALARWQHPEQGEIPPATFVPVAERTELSRKLDRWAIGRGVADLARLRAAQVVSSNAGVAVNLTARHLDDRDLEQFIVTAVVEAGLSPRHVTLELTESSVLRDTPAAAAMLRRLTERGFGVALDDFGTGYSSIAYLRNFPVSLLKIDRSFVADMLRDGDAYAIVTSIIQMARAVGVRSVAEGVETSEQATALRQLGCDAAQGWLWSPAVPTDELARTPRRFAVTGVGAVTTSHRTRTAPIDEEHGLVRLLELQRQGASLTTIAAALNADGYRTPSGKAWHKMTVARALSSLEPVQVPAPRTG